MDDIRIQGFRLLRVLAIEVFSVKTSVKTFTTSQILHSLQKVVGVAEFLKISHISTFLDLISLRKSCRCS